MPSSLTFADIRVETREGVVGWGEAAAYLLVALTATPVTWGCELFGPLLLADDVTRDPGRYADGAILGLDAPGLGVDETALKEWTRHR